MAGSDLSAVVLVGSALSLLLGACALTPSLSVDTPESPADPTLTRPSDGMETVRVPGGSFVMGSTDAEVDWARELCNEAYGNCQRDWFKDEQPAHEVTLTAFHIDRTEVTNGQFAAFLNAQRDEAEGDLTWAGVLLALGSEHCLIE